ncbi:hypothetical protein C5S29_07930 [ANME-1 cluster archaeon GoMg3.2]|nr:hypothetical protein [ANME-1 cluster archaeon GoMg3.2]
MQERPHFWETDKKYARVVMMLIPVILGIITLVLPIALEEEKHLSLEVIENKALISVDQKIREEITISYNDKVVERLFLLTVKFVNDGDFGINGKTDIIENIEISLREDNCKILGEPEILENPSDIKLAFYPAMDQKTVKFDFDLMNPHDYFLMDILYTANALACLKDPLHAKIVDIKDIEIRSKTESGEKELGINLMLIIQGFILVVIGLFGLYERRFKLMEKTTRKVFSYKNTFLFYAAIGCVFFYMGFWGIASPLDYPGELFFGSNPLLIIWGMAIFMSIFIFAFIVRDMFFARKIA